MLEQCFIHLPGIGPSFEEKLRQSGCGTWEDALQGDLPCGPGKADILRSGLEKSRRRLAAGDAMWFGNALPPAQQWRLYPHFRHSAAYVDIETTGLSRDYDCITTIALYDGSGVRTYVQGENLEDFADDILRYQLLVTWNGRGFDAPILRKSLQIPLDKGNMAHLDLLPVFRALNLKGGLKKVEKRLGLDREELDGVDGMAAVWLWREYERSGNRRALETLLAYNVADVLSLEYLAHYALMRHSGQTDPGLLPPLKSVLNPFSADPDILRRLPRWP